MAKILCRPCAAQVQAKSKYYVARKDVGVDTKGTCEMCGRRRYVAEYTEDRTRRLSR